MSDLGTVRDLRAADLPEVGNLVKASFEPDLTPFMVATQSGWPEFLRVVVDHPEQFPHRLAVVERKGDIVAFADLRVPEPSHAFLSYICVAAEARGQGVARHLLTRLLEAHAVRTAQLEVFVDNAPAVAMYRAMGFRDGPTQTWWRAPAVSSHPRANLVLDDLAGSMAALRTYGFCELRGTWDERPFRCGRLGTGVLRLFTEDDFHDLDLVGALAFEFPEIRDAFAVLLDAAATPPGATQVARAVRMTADLVDRTEGA